MRKFLNKLLSERYGPDNLGVAIIILSLIPSILYAVLQYALLLYLAYLLFATVLFRMLSYNIRRRRAENDRYIRYWWPIRTRVLRFFTKIKNFFKKKKKK